MLNFINPKDPLVTEDEMYSFYPKVVDKRGNWNKIWKITSFI